MPSLLVAHARILVSTDLPLGLLEEVRVVLAPHGHIHHAPDLGYVTVDVDGIMTTSTLHLIEAALKAIATRYGTAGYTWAGEWEGVDFVEHGGPNVASTLAAELAHWTVLEAAAAAQRRRVEQAQAAA